MLLNQMLVTILILASAVGASSTANRAVSDSLPRIELRVAAFIDLFFTARADAVDERALIDGVDGWDDLLDAVRGVNEALGGSFSLSWGMIGGAAAGCERAAEFRAIVDRIPESITGPDGSAIPLRSRVVRLAEALERVEQQYLSHTWPDRMRVIEARRAELEETLCATLEKWMPLVLSGMNMRKPQPVVPVFLVHDAPFPGAVTHRTREGGACFVAISMEHDDDLRETVIHEIMHAFDVSTAGEPTALQQVRSALRESGVGPTDQRIRDLPHLLIFIHAAETVRRTLDASHLDYGIAAGVYDRLAGSAQLRDLWRRYLDREIDLDHVIKDIVAATERNDDPVESSP